MTTMCWECGKTGQKQNCADCYASRIGSTLLHHVRISPQGKKWINNYERACPKYEVRVMIFRNDLKPIITAMPPELLDAYALAINRMNVTDPDGISMGKVDGDLIMITSIKPRGPMAEVVGPEVPLAKVVDEKKGL